MPVPELREKPAKPQGNVIDYYRLSVRLYFSAKFNCANILDTILKNRRHVALSEVCITPSTNTWVECVKAGSQYAAMPTHRIASPPL